MKFGGIFIFMKTNIETNEVKYEITFDPRKRKLKPTEEEAITITSHLTTQTEVTIKEFSELVSAPNSLTWSGAQFNGTRSNMNWVSQSIFGIDSDNGTITVEEIYSKLKEFGIVPQLWYTSFSDSPALRKFRVVIFLDTPISDVGIHKLIYQALFSMFPELDIACKDASRFFYGGKECTLIHTEPVSTSTFIDAMTIQMYSSDSKSFRNTPLESSYYTSLKSAQKPTFLYNIYRSDQIWADRQPHSTTSIQGGNKVKIDFEVARKKIKILDEFLYGEWLYHTQLFGLATNLIYVEGGFQLMKKTMEKYNEEGKTQYTQNNFNILPYVNKVKYFPKLIQEFSPYIEDGDLYDVVSATRDVRGLIEPVETINRIKLSEAENLLKMKYDQVMSKGEVGKIYLFSLPTAIGKTQSLIGTKSTIALPTIGLKNEIGERMKIKYVITPDPVSFGNESINRKIQYYYSMGLPKKATGILHHIINPKNSLSYSVQDIQVAEKYLSDLSRSINSTEAILTTHKRALFTEFGNDTIIFDEDPLNSLLEIKEMKINDLYELYLRAGKRELKTICEYLESTSEFELKTTPSFLFDIDELIESVSSTGMESNVFEFFNSSFFIRTSKNSVHYVVKRNIPTNKKVIIMSATIPIYIYQKLFGDRVEVIDIRDVEQIGSITQYTRWSCSRNGLNRYVETISKLVGDTPVITIKSFGHQFQNPVKDMYFGNCSGYDTLKGKDLAVVGTFHRNNIEYFLTAKALGIDFKTTDTTMSHQKIEYNGFRFKFNCFDNENLRRIQLSLIESDLIQAVGRARTLRTSAHVDLYSNFPLRISDEFRY